MPNWFSPRALYLNYFPEPPEVIAQTVSAYQVLQLQRQMPVLNLVAGFNVGVIMLASMLDGASLWYQIFPAMIIAFNLARIFIWWRRGSATIDPARAREVLHKAIVAVAVAVGMASGWAVYSFEMQLYAQPALVPMSLAVGMFCAANCLAVLPAAAILALLIGMMPISYVMMTSGDNLSFALSITIFSGALFQIKVLHEQYSQIIARLSLEAQIRDQANTDVLTGLPNRRAVMAMLDQAVASGRDFAVALLDLDGFKNVNDSMGHATGDKLLQHVGVSISAACANGDSAGRLGGDEFVVLFMGVSGAQDVAARAQQVLISLCKPADVDGRAVAVSASLGFAIFPRHGSEATQLLKAADEALYVAKQTGKACAREFDAATVTAAKAA